MKAEDLKNSILQLAMEGKLVPQNPNDEPASVLLEKIREEKEQLIKEKKIRSNNKESFIYKKDNHYFEKIGKKGKSICIDEEIPFEIPDSWEWCTLENIVELINGDRGKNYPAKSKLSSIGNIPFISAINLENGQINENNLLYLSYEQYNLLSRGKLKNNDLIFCLRGSLGKNGIFNMLKGAIASSLVILRRYSEDIDLKYLFYYINSNLVALEIKKYDNGTAQPNLSASNLKKFFIPIPPLNEQKRIVEEINKLNPLINEYDINKKKLDKLNSEFPDKLKSSILQEAIQGKLIPQDSNDEPASVLLEKIKNEKERLIKEKKIRSNNKESFIYKKDNHYFEKIGKKGEPVCIDEEIPFDIPDNWTWCKLENLIELISGRDLKKTQYNDLKKGIPYVTGASNIINNQLLINRWTNEPAVIAVKNDILLSCKGTIGKILILNEDKVHIARQIMSIRLINEMLINRGYIVIFLMYYVTNLINIAKSMIPGISREDVLKINVPLPPLDEQKRIVEKIVSEFGGRDGFLNAIHDLQKELYVD